MASARGQRLGATQPDDDGVPETAIPRGTTIGRYVVLDPLGAGSMGVVLSAIDPALDRKVALKLVKATGEPEDRQRLLREGQAMARLAHPNVVTVYEVGEYDNRVFLAMEYIRGGTLTTWLAAAKRTWREIVDAFVAAGRGLAAAHRAGIVHRDFKPANVLVGEDGRPRVADFGLATSPEGAGVSTRFVTPDPEDLAMTATGAIMGTPAYMPPEQHQGNSLDARVDQFAFCVAVYHALYGELPFDGTDHETYAKHVLAGKLREAPRRTDVPVRLRKVLVRGLAVDPDARFPSMDALLAELAHDPVTSRVHVAAVAGGALVIATALVVARGAIGDAMDPCAATSEPIADLWSTTERAQLERAFVAGPSPIGAPAFARTAHLLDGRVGELVAGRREACLATEVRREQSAELLDRRTTCLDERIAETRALIAVLSDHPDAATIAKGPEAIATLTAVAACADRAGLVAGVPRPAAPATRAMVETFERELAWVQALDAAGKTVEAQARLVKPLHEIDAVDYAPARAWAHFHDARLRTKLGQHREAADELRQVGELAAAAKDDNLLARTWTLLYAVVGYRLGQREQAKTLEPTVVAAIVRAGNTPEHRADFDNARGALELAAGDYVASAEHFSNASQQFARALGANHPRAIGALANAGLALESAGRYTDAESVVRRALALRVEQFGADHD
jgi:tetratricopeptide (TPR) repeat protein/predicted Ser/Thr protein kinase